MVGSKIEEIEEIEEKEKIEEIEKIEKLVLFLLNAPFSLKPQNLLLRNPIPLLKPKPPSPYLTSLYQPVNSAGCNTEFLCCLRNVKILHTFPLFNGYKTSLALSYCILPQPF